MPSSTGRERSIVPTGVDERSRRMMGLRARRIRAARAHVDDARRRRDVAAGVVGRRDDATRRAGRGGDGGDGDATRAEGVAGAAARGGRRGAVSRDDDDRDDTGGAERGAGGAMADVHGDRDREDDGRARGGRRVRGAGAGAGADAGLERRRGGDVFEKDSMGPEPVERVRGVRAQRSHHRVRGVVSGDVRAGGDRRTRGSRGERHASVVETASHRRGVRGREQGGDRAPGGGHRQRFFALHDRLLVVRWVLARVGWRSDR